MKFGPAGGVALALAAGIAAGVVVSLGAVVVGGARNKPLAYGLPLAGAALGALLATRGHKPVFGAAIAVGALGAMATPVLTRGAIAAIGKAATPTPAPNTNQETRE